MLLLCYFNAKSLSITGLLIFLQQNKLFINEIEASASKN
jgi:hypothetical protein